MILIDSIRLACDLEAENWLNFFSHAERRYVALFYLKIGWNGKIAKTEGKCEQYGKIIIQDIQAWWIMLQKVLTF